MVALFARQVAVYPGDGLGEERAATTVRLNLSAPTKAMEDLRGVLGEALDEAASGRWRAAVAHTARRQGDGRARRGWPTACGRADDGRAAHGRARFAAVAGRPRPRAHPPARVPRAWTRGVARRRGGLLVQDQPAAGASCARWPPRAPGHEVVCEAEYALARDAIGAAGPDVIVNGPVKSDALLERAAGDGALVIVDSEPELARAARGRRRARRPARRAAGHRGRADALRHRARTGARGRRARARAGPRARGAERPPRLHRLRAAARRRAALGAAITVQWPPPPAATRRPPSSWRAWPSSLGVAAIDLGGGFPAAPAVAAHAAAVAGALRAAGFAGRLMLEPGRALVADAVGLAFTVVAVKHLDDGTRRGRRRRHEPAARHAVGVAADRGGRAARGRRRRRSSAARCA